MNSSTGAIATKDLNDPSLGDEKGDVLEMHEDADLKPQHSSVEDKNAEKIQPKKKDNRFTYKDYSHIEATHPLPASTLSPNSSAIRVQKLPAKLNAMLSNPSYQHIISWMPHGRSWKVHNPHSFVEEVIPKYFEYTNYNSFVRLVNAWGFRRITKGPDRNSYYHELFLRGMPHLHGKMHRLTANEKKLPVDPEDEPDFYKISAVCPLPPVSHAPGVSAKGVRAPHNQLCKQAILNQMGASIAMGGLGGFGSLAGAGLMGAPDMMGASYHNLAAARTAAAAKIEEEELAIAAARMPASASFLPAMAPTLAQQRAEMVAANQAFELQAARLREQERRLALLSGGASAGLGSTGLGVGLGNGLGGYPARIGRDPGLVLPPTASGLGMYPDDMLSHPAGVSRLDSRTVNGRL